MDRTGKVKSKPQLIAENNELRARLEDAEETLRAIRHAEVDALVVSGENGEPQVFTVQGADRSYRVLVENMGEGTLNVAQDGLILYSNRRLAVMAGAPLETVIGSNIQAWITPESRSSLALLLQKGETPRRSAEMVLTTRTGTQVPVLVSASPLNLEELPDSFCLVMTDLTEMKRSEKLRHEAEERFNHAFRSSPVGIHIFRLADGRSLDVNQAYLNLVGYSRDELLGHSAAEINLLVHPEQRSTWMQTLREQGAVTSIETSIRNKSGEIRHTLFSMEPLDMNGEAAVMVLSFDITDRKQAEQALAESEARFRNLADTAPVLIWKSGTDALCDYFNQSWLDFTGRTFEQELGNGWAEGVHAEDYQRCQDIYLTAFKAQCEFKMEFRLRRANDEYGWLLDNGVPRFSPDGSFNGFIGSCIDITEGKVAEESLLRAQIFLESVIEQSPTSLWISDEHGTLTRMNQACRDILCLQDEEVVGKYNIFKDNIVESQGFMPMVRDVFEKGTIARFVISYDTATLQGFELRLTTRVDLDVNISPILDPQGKVIHTIVQHLDITERRRVEDAMRESEARYRTLFENMQEGFSLNEIITDANGRAVDFRILDANSAYERNSGLKPAEIIGKTILEIMPQVDPRQIEQYGRVALTGEPLTFEYYSKAFNRHLRVRVFSPQPGRFAAIFEDVSEYRLAEAAVRAGEEKFRRLFESMSQGVVYYDSAGKMTAANLSAERILGLSQEQLLGHAYISPNWKIFKQDGSELANEEHPLAVALRTGRPVEGFVLRLDSPKSSAKIWLSTSAIPLFRSGQERPYQVYSIFDDITARKQAEMALLASESKLRAILDNSADAIGVHINGIWELCNPAAVRMFGVASAQELIGSPILNVVTLPERERVRDYVRKRNQAEDAPEAYVTRGLRADGSEFDMEVTLSSYSLEGKLHALVILRDITERRVAEENLRSARLFLQRVQDSLLAHIVILDKDGAIIHCNRAWRQFGQENGLNSPDSCIGMNYLAVCDDTTGAEAGDARLTAARIRAVLAGQEDHDRIEYPCHAPDQKRWFTLNITRFDDGEQVWVVLTHEEITQRKMAENKLRDSEEHLRMIFDTLSEGVSLNEMVFDAAGSAVDYRILEVNNAFYHVADFRNEGTVIGGLATNLYGMSVETIRSFWENHRSVTGMQYTEMISPISRRIFAIFTSPMVNNRFVTSFQDITERRQAEEALRSSEKLYRDMFENNSAVKLLLDPASGAIRHANKAAAKFYGYSHEQLETMNIREIGVGTVDDFASALANAAAHESAYYNFQHRLASGEVRDVEVYTGPIVVDGQTLLHSIIHDVTERRVAEAALKAAHYELETRVLERTADLQSANIALGRASKAKDDFMAIMSHELRTPLTGILGLSQVLQFNTYGEMNAKQATAVQNIEKSGQHLLELINQILDYSKLQSGKVELEKSLCSLDSICAACLRMVEPISVKKNQELSFQISPDNILLQADERRLRQVLINLLGNAIKFTPDGGRIELKVTGIAEAGQVFISVRDTGIGIKEEDLPRLFQPFVQLDMRLSRQFEGTGLGLALVSQLVGLHGGSVEVESTFGQGSLFTVILPWESR